MMDALLTAPDDAVQRDAASELGPQRVDDLGEAASERALVDILVTGWLGAEGLAGSTFGHWECVRAKGMRSSSACPAA
jgi:hypothetical protein